jgi:hypothetical protein
MRIEKDFKEFIALLNKNSAHYLIVGGYAFSFHAEPRFTKDIDFFVEMSPQNADKIMKTLTEFGFKNIGLEKEDFMSPNQIIQLGYAPVRIDIVTTLKAVDFDSAWQNRVEGKYGDIPAFFISKTDLIKNKSAVGRKQDEADIEKLQKI